MLHLRCFEVYLALRQAVLRFCLRSFQFIDLIPLHSPCGVNRNRELRYKFLLTGPHWYELGCLCLSLHYLLQFLFHIIRFKLLKIALSSVLVNEISVFGLDISHPSLKTHEKNLQKIKRKISSFPLQKIWY